MWRTRANMKTNFSKIKNPAVAVLLAVGLSGCAVNPDTGRVGMDTNVFSKNSMLTIGGGLVGAAVCNQLFKGHGSKEGWTAACGVGGYFLSRAFIERSNGVLESNRTGQTSRWRDPDGRQVSMTPRNTYYAGGQPCRQYETEIIVDGRPEIASGTACRNGNGTWKIQS